MLRRILTSSERFLHHKVNINHKSWSWHPIGQSAAQILVSPVLLPHEWSALMPFSRKSCLRSLPQLLSQRKDPFSPHAHCLHLQAGQQGRSAAMQLEGGNGRQQLSSVVHQQLSSVVHLPAASEERPNYECTVCYESSEDRSVTFCGCVALAYKYSAL